MAPFGPNANLKGASSLSVGAGSLLTHNNPAAAFSANNEPSRIYLLTIATDRWSVCAMIALEENCNSKSLNPRKLLSLSLSSLIICLTQ